MDKSLLDTLPHRRMEAWKWTDVRRELGDEHVSGFSQICVPNIVVPKGIAVTQATYVPITTPMSALAARFVDKCTIISVPENYKSGESIRIDVLENGHASIVFKIAKGAEIIVEEIHKTDTPSFINLEFVFELAQGAKLTRQISHHDHADTTRICTAHINAWADVSITQHALSFGGGLARFETRIASLGENLKAEINGAYLLKDKRHCDMTSYIDLGAPNAHIRQSVKGVVTDKARGVFQGKFHVRRPAQHTDAEMRHDAIMLSDTCEIRAKPELEIYADDVACAHGNTVGALDESALFYMRSRGIPLKQSRALLTQAFVSQAFENMDDNAEFTKQVSNWLEQNA